MYTLYMMMFLAGEDSSPPWGGGGSVLFLTVIFVLTCSQSQPMYTYVRSLQF